MGIAGIPWWTTDIGGFHGGDPTSPAFRELFVRWFQWGAFCPVMRLHGDREPKQEQVGTTGGAACLSGAPNEVWSYGKEVYEICKKYLLIREELRSYTRSLMLEAHEKGTPVIRPLFYEFPADRRFWEVIYLPARAKWKIFKGENFYEGGGTVEIDAPLDTIPVFIRR
jgi:alpha-D-xyloside xylohydrolase